MKKVIQNYKENIRVSIFMIVFLSIFVIILAITVVLKQNEINELETYINYSKDNFSMEEYSQGITNWDNYVKYSVGRGVIPYLMDGNNNKITKLYESRVL